VKDQITLSRHEAEEVANDLDGWATVLDSEGEHPWCEDMLRHARMLRDKLLGRIE